MLRAGCAATAGGHSTLTVTKAMRSYLQNEWERQVCADPITV